MHELTPDELLSAYLDGELTADEQARAERLIAADDQARRLFDELRGMRSCLQGLPRQELPDDFAARVLRAAERQTRVAGTPATHDPVPAPAWQERIRRPLAYAAMVLAASVLIAIFRPDQPGIDGPPQPVVLAPEATPPEDSRSVDDFTPAFGAPSMTAAPDPESAAEERRSGQADRPLSSKFAEDLTVGTGGEPAPARKGAALGIAPVDGLATDVQGVPQADKGLLVVTCEITPSAARKDSFRQLLTRNQISLDEGESLQRAPNQPAAPTPPADRETASKRAEATTDLELVYVKATPEQLEATLADMAAQSKEFLSVDVGAAEARGVQTRWQDQYSWGRGGMSQQRFLAPPAAPDAAKQLVPSAAPEPAKPSSPKPAANEPQPDEGQAANRQGQSASRARAYAMPAEGLNYQRGAPPVMLQQQQPVAGEALPGNKLERKLAQKGDSPAPPAEGAGTPAQNFYAQEPGTLRALFVLRVADEPTPPATNK